MLLQGSLNFNRKLKNYRRLHKKKRKKVYTVEFTVLIVLMAKFKTNKKKS